MTTSAMHDLAGARVLVLNWRDIRHPQAGGAEQYMHQIARRWVAEGVDVTWWTARSAALPFVEVVDGITVVRRGGPLSQYAWAALGMRAARGQFDAVVDCQNGIPFFAPVFAGRDLPVVQVVHHVHQDQFSSHFSPPMAMVGRLLEGPVSRRVYRSSAIAAVSPSTRLELRRRLGFRGPISIVPNGTVEVPVFSGPRDIDPTIAVVSRLVQHKRIDLLLGQVARAAPGVPNLRVDVVGDGPEGPRLRALAADLGLQDVVTFHGYQPDDVRDRLLSRAWLTTSTSEAEGWGCAVVEAAARGVPCVGLHVPGIRDSVIDGVTGWLVQRADDLGPALVTALTDLADEGRAAEVSAACQEWSRCFSWDRSAELLAGVLVEQVRAGRMRGAGRADRRFARSDIATVARFPTAADVDLRAALRATDVVVHEAGETRLLLGGCDDHDAATVLVRLGIADADLRLAVRRDFLVGPGGGPTVPGPDLSPAGTA